MQIFNQFRAGLKKTSTFLYDNITNVIKSKKINQETLDEIEGILLSADIGLEVTNLLTEKIKSKKISNVDDSNMILNIIANEIEKILLPREKKLIENDDITPRVLLFIGVNGSGKTTTIGKLINLIPKKKKILVAACDTFRAAAVDQLREWSNQEGIDFFQGSIQQDPASVAYNACKKSKEENYDYLIIDTAGRLSNNTNLLNQLIKIKSVVNKSLNEKNIKTLLVLDGTNGSNMVNQVDIFSKSMAVSGLIITKIDGTAKGGALISIAKKYEIPINFVGLGEKKDDLYEFSAKEFSYSILGIKN